MPKKRPAKPWLPKPESVLEVKEVDAPEGAFRIIRTNIVDPYEKPLAPKPRHKKKRSPA